MLPDQYRITRQDLKAALARQKTELRQGDIVLIRTGRMKLYNDPAAYMGCRPAWAWTPPATWSRKAAP